MNYKSAIACLILTALSAYLSAHAAVNDGKFDCQWLSARIKTKAPIALDWTDPQVGVVLRNAKSPSIDSGKDNCYVLLDWWGPGTYTYQMRPVCRNGDGVWRQAAFLRNGLLFEINDGKSIGSDWANIYLPQQNGIFYDLNLNVDGEEEALPDNHTYVGYEGTILLSLNLKRDGSVRNIARRANTGMFYSWNNNTEVGGTSRGGSIQLRYIASNSVPAPAKAAAGVCP